MSIYIARARPTKGGVEVEVVQDIYDACGRDIIGCRSFGWHPEACVTHNGVDVDEIWLKTQQPSALNDRESILDLRGRTARTVHNPTLQFAL